MDKGEGVMMKNMAEELALLDSLLISFKIYEIKESQSHDLISL